MRAFMPLAMLVAGALAAQAPVDAELWRLLRGELREGGLRAYGGYSPFGRALAVFSFEGGEAHWRPMLNSDFPAVRALGLCCLAGLGKDLKWIRAFALDRGPFLWREEGAAEWITVGELARHLIQRRRHRKTSRLIFARLDLWLEGCEQRPEWPGQRFRDPWEDP